MRQLKLLIAIPLAILMAVAIVRAQIALPPTAAVVGVCAYNSVLPTLTSGTFSYIQCNSSNQVVIH